MKTFPSFQALLSALHKPPERGPADAEPSGRGALISVFLFDYNFHNFPVDLIQRLMKVQRDSRRAC